MKKLLSIALCAVTASAFAEGELPAAAELGTVGVTAITTSLSNAIVAVSYDDLAGGEGIVVSNFVKTTNLTVGDQLAVFTNGVYSTWRLAQVVGATGSKYWAKNEKEFTVGSDGKLQEGTGSAAADVTQAVGTGIWLVRQNPIAEGGSTNTFYIYGKPVTSRTLTLVKDKWNLVGNPMQSRATISGSFSVDDEIVVPLEPGGRLSRYTYSAGGWRKVGADDKWVYGPPVLQPGLGCWIRTKESTTISWSASN